MVFPPSRLPCSLPMAFPLDVGDLFPTVQANVLSLPAAAPWWLSSSTSHLRSLGHDVVHLANHWCHTSRVMCSTKCLNM
ncbi:hypothetical protein ZEAMMB73_Zm00001d024083 [Zea mays]|uniref:Uncharacterized protein n=1 Tax=Zea mays TaxID=4577 RepID=A0A1D6IXL4_MAIZE|nr:hypothetical protein ZEAMMB73_Zm00001d024083 [Zea mays]AQK40650.1 hypothetical protein ZEAMMB73_Zm00001d024083 [Zea mays]